MNELGALQGEGFVEDFGLEIGTVGLSCLVGGGGSGFYRHSNSRGMRP